MPAATAKPMQRKRPCDEEQQQQRERSGQLWRQVAADNFRERCDLWLE